MNPEICPVDVSGPLGISLSTRKLSTLTQRKCPESMSTRKKLSSNQKTDSEWSILSTEQNKVKILTRVRLSFMRYFRLRNDGM